MILYHNFRSYQYASSHIPQSVPVLPLTQFAPQYLGEPSQQTEIRVAYDDTFIYVSGRMYDSDPRSTRGNTPIPPVSQGRAVMVKYTHTLAWEEPDVPRPASPTD